MVDQVDPEAGQCLVVPAHVALCRGETFDLSRNDISSRVRAVMTQDQPGESQMACVPEFARWKSVFVKGVKEFSIVHDSSELSSESAPICFPPNGFGFLRSGPDEKEEKCRHGREARLETNPNSGAIVGPRHEVLHSRRLR